LNLLAHVRVALDVLEDPDPEAILGAVLPDLEGLVGQRVDRSGRPEVERGVAVHRATDAAFHDDPRFRQGSIALSRRLQARGVGRGASRAVGHAGWELLLDGLLVEDREVTEAFATAAGALLELAVRTEGPTDRLEWLAERQRIAPIWAAYADPVLVADRLHRQLAGRPRLALRSAERGPVAEELAVAAVQVRTDGPAVLRDVTEATRLSGRGGPARTEPSR
jgi:hypothetical protein